MFGEHHRKEVDEHSDDLRRALAELKVLIKANRSAIAELRRLILHEEKIMSAGFDALKAAVANQTTIDASVEALGEQLKALIAANVDDPAALQALADQLTAEQQNVAAWVVQNTPTPTTSATTDAAAAAAAAAASSATDAAAAAAAGDTAAVTAAADAAPAAVTDAAAT